MRRTTTTTTGDTAGPRGAEGGTAARSLTRLGCLAALALTLLGGCGTLLRLPPPPPGEALTMPVLGVPNARFWLDGPAEPLLAEVRAMRERRAASGLDRRPETHILALSGGGDDGAFGAGLVTGWTESGSRPEFDVVTGVSAGALIAPFAFLGPDQDPALRAVFTEVRPTDVLVVGRVVLGLLFRDAVADTSPLARLIERHADEALLAAVAREHGRGRLLLVATTNLDLQRPAAWNLGAIAASGHPGALALFRRVLLASASIPGAFPPVMLDVETSAGTRQEMHVDGGAATQVFFYPPSLDLARGGGTAAGRPGPARTVWVVRNGRVRMDADAPERGIFAITSRSARTLLHFSGVSDVGRIYLTARRDGMAFRFAHIGDDFRADRPEAFDSGYMRALFEHGRQTALSGRGWLTAPPVVGLEGTLGPPLERRADPLPEAAR